MKDFESLINQAWEERDHLKVDLSAPWCEAVQQTLHALDCGKIRVAEKIKGQWQIHTWIKKAIVLSFRIHNNFLSVDHGVAYDKIALKFETWKEGEFSAAGFRAVPGSVVRYSAYIAPDVVLMPSFVNIGAYVGRSSMIDTWATVGSCVQVGERCHISGGVGLGGVLEPLQAQPVIIEDDCFIGARSEIVEGVIVEHGSVLGMGVFIGASTPIVSRDTGAISYGRVPAYSVVIAGSMPTKVSEQGPVGLALNCAVIVKQVDEKTRAKTSINMILRDF